METEDLVVIGVVGLVLYLLVKPGNKSAALEVPATLAPYVPKEVVTSKITYGVPVTPDLVESKMYPGYTYSQASGDYVNLQTGEHMMID